MASAALESGGRSARGTTGEAGMKHWVRNVAAVVPAPAWFIALDLLLAYLPMAWLATRLGGWLRR